MKMKKQPLLVLLVTSSLVALTAMAADPQNGMNMPGMHMPGMHMSGAASAQKEKVSHTTGKVVHAPRSRITIAHHPVVALGWPAMTMTFQASSQQLKGIKAGDQVDFEFTLRGKAALIERIRKIG